MFTIKRTNAFAAWFDGLKDRQTRIRLNRRLDRAQCGHLGDVQTVGAGLFEMREHFGPGWRMYYVQRGTALIVMLGGALIIIPVTSLPARPLVRTADPTDRGLNVGSAVRTNRRWPKL